MRYIFCLLTLFTVGPAFPQCSEIYFYRPTSILSSEDVAFLYYDGESLTAIRPGDRFKLVACSEGTYDFTLRDANGTIFSKTVGVDVKYGDQHFIKVSMPLGVPAASIKSVADGIKEINASKNFKSSLRSINIKNTSVVQHTAPQNTQGSMKATTSNSAAGGGSFQRVQIVNNFKFEIVNIIKGGDVFKLEYKVTNLASVDRNLCISGESSAFYDDLGNFYTLNNYCLLKQCNHSPGYKSPSPSFLRGEFYGRSPSCSLIPSNLPINASITIKNIDNAATSFYKGDMILLVTDKTNNLSRENLRLSYSNIPIPTDLDMNNPMNKIVGAYQFELLSANRSGEETLIKLKIKNTDQQPYTLDVKDVAAFDDLGNQYKITAFKDGYSGEKASSSYYWKSTVDAQSQKEVQLFLEKIDPRATRLNRITIEFTDFNLSWDNVSLSGSNTQKPIANNGSISLSNGYISYGDFEKNVRLGISASGMKTILENLYFNTNSDQLLPSSQTQLTGLSQILKENGNVRLEISGHTDNVGDDIENLLLSQKRADAVRYFLIKEKISPDRLTSIGKGENEPVADNNSTDGRQMNRRVEIKIVE
ncbi:MAG: OmpA family protein [Saprospiraceae bacterium]|nr:OmpA family protein [Saprospiraceae bacterium]